MRLPYSTGCLEWLLDLIRSNAHEKHQLYLLANGICHRLKGNLLVIAAHNNDQFLLERTQSCQYTGRAGGDAVVIPLDTVQFPDKFDAMLYAAEIFATY